MSLNLYLRRSDCPADMVDVNDFYFNMYGRLQDIELVRKFLHDIDDAEYNSATSVHSLWCNGDIITIDKLSTGLKTLLNIVQFPDVCFSLKECGRNVLRLLPLIRNGNAYWGNQCITILDNYDCDIMCDGYKFSKFLDFLNYVRYDVDLTQEGWN